MDLEDARQHEERVTDTVASLNQQILTAQLELEDIFADLDTPDNSDDDSDTTDDKVKEAGKDEQNGDSSIDASQVRYVYYHLT